MNSGERELNAELNAIESEILMLKTAHQRPLGVLDFFQDAVTIPVQFKEAYGGYYSDIKVVVKVATPTAKPPIVQAGWGVPAGFHMVNFYGVATSSDYAEWTYNLNLSGAGTMPSVNLPFGAVSSQPIESIAWSFS